MQRLTKRIVLCISAVTGLLAARLLPAQTPAALLEQYGASPLATDVTFPVSRTAQYRVAWGITDAHAKPDSIVPALKNAANFIYLAEHNGIPRANRHLAVVIWGTATHSLLRNEAYRTVKGADNASAPILQALHDAGVEIIVCGEALINRRIDRKDLLPFVRIAPTASMALATLHTQGYLVLMP